MTRLLFVGTSYPTSPTDWKGRFLADMAAALARRPELALSLWVPPGDLPPDALYAAPASDQAWLQALMAKGGIAAQLRRGKLAGAASAAGLLARLYRTYRHTAFDIAHVNWLQNALPLWGTRTPALVTVLGSDYGLLGTPGMNCALRAVFAQRPTVLAPNADWMAQRLETAFGDVAEIHPVPFGVDRRWFEVDRNQAAPGCWLAVTRLTRNKLGDLFDWGEGLFGPERRLHLFGPLQETVTLPSWLTWHGPTHAQELREQWFPRATGFITLSRHDEGRPQVLLDAMASGLPVLASDLPAHRDFIRSGETGYVVHDRDELGSALATLDDMTHNHRLGMAGRDWVKHEVGDWDDCAARYAALYRRLETR